MTPFYGRLPDVGGFGIESKVDLIGASLAAGAVAGVAAHAIATGVDQIRRRRQLPVVPNPPAPTDREGGQNG
jgi:hydrogenase small subunit